MFFCYFTNKIYYLVSKLQLHVFENVDFFFIQESFILFTIYAKKIKKWNWTSKKLIYYMQQYHACIWIAFR